jgi:O-methyltransferase
MNQEEFCSIVEPYTMTSKERIHALFNSLEYIRINNIEGDIIECGVWMGGNILGCIEYCKFYNMDKNFWLYDTFTGMTEPTQFDVDIYYTDAKSWVGKSNYELNEVKKIILATNYPENKINFVVGDVLETLQNQNNIPKSISILRLDTDWYESTKKELEILYPILNSGGVLIVDDYGHWYGAQKAFDEYFNGSEVKKEQIDYTGIKIIKKNN